MALILFFILGYLGYVYLYNVYHLLRSFAYWQLSPIVLITPWILTPTIHDVLHYWAWALRRKGHYCQRFGGLHAIRPTFFIFDETSQAVKSCSRVYLEAYTSILMVEKSRLVRTVLKAYLLYLTVWKAGGVL